MTTTAEKAVLLSSLHVPGDPLIVTNIWDAVTARIVGDLPEVRALATASHAVSFAHGVADNEGLTLDQAIEAARIITAAVEKPVSVDFEKGYAADAAGVKRNVARLIDAGAAGLNIEDSLQSAAGPYRTSADAADRVAADEAGGHSRSTPGWTCWWAGPTTGTQPSIAPTATLTPARRASSSSGSRPKSWSSAVSRRWRGRSRGHRPSEGAAAQAAGRPRGGPGQLRARNDGAHARASAGCGIHPHGPRALPA